MAYLPYWHDGAGKIWTKGDITTVSGSDYTKQFYAYYNNDLTASLQSGLVAYYKMDGNANDSSGNGYNGTVTGATLSTNHLKRPNTGYAFSGTSQYIELPFTGGSSYTTMILFKAKALSASSYYWLSGGKTNKYSQNAYIYNNAGTYQIGFSTNASDNYNLTNIPSYAPDTWHVFSMSLSGDTKKIHLDGSSILSASDTGTVSTDTSYYIGRRQDLTTNMLNGNIAMVLSWNRQLSDAEQTAVYDTIKGTYFSGDNTFEFFDDFEGVTLNASKWTTSTDFTATVSNSNVTITTNTAHHVQKTGIFTTFDFASLGSYGVFGRMYFTSVSNALGAVGVILSNNSTYTDITNTSRVAIYDGSAAQANGAEQIAVIEDRYDGTAYAIGAGWYKSNINLIDGTWTLYFNGTLRLTSTVTLDCDYLYLWSSKFTTYTQVPGVYDYVFVTKESSATITPTYGSEETGTYSVEGKYFTKRRLVTITSSVSLSAFQVELDYTNFNSQADIVLDDEATPPVVTGTDSIFYGHEF